VLRWLIHNHKLQKWFHGTDQPNLSTGTSGVT